MLYKEQWCVSRLRAWSSAVPWWISLCLCHRVKSTCMETICPTCVAYCWPLSTVQLQT